MHNTQRLIKIIDQITDVIGRTIAWLTLVMMLVTTLVVVLRYIFNIGSIAVQESITYLHALVFMLGAAYALKRDTHVRVDIFYRSLNPKNKAVIDCLGSLFLLLPTCIFIFWSSLDYVSASWGMLEASQESGGIPAVFLLKTLIPLMAILLIAQGSAEFLRNFLVVLGSQAMPAPHKTSSGV